MPTTTYGMSFANTISNGRTGVTNKASNVPRSLSRAITRPVKNAPIKVKMSTIKPGTKNQVLLPDSLNHILCSILTALADANIGLRSICIDGAVAKAPATYPSKAVAMVVDLPFNSN
ncbi:Uncharacterised protein [Acinetobacter baumannii]|nr:Uncharacterised protein [Acinetobacter baumannii]SSU42263.1 Uncharacterised protein [Acinetobacter baumannii]